MIKLLLVLLLGFCGTYGWLQRKISFAVGAGLPLVCALGILLVLQPDLSNRAARAMGVGRGVDLILYLWVVVTLLLLANVHFRLRSQRAMITTLTRDLALLEAEVRSNREA